MACKCVVTLLALVTVAIPSASANPAPGTCRSHFSLILCMNYRDFPSNIRLGSASKAPYSSVYLRRIYASTIPKSAMEHLKDARAMMILDSPSLSTLPGNLLEGFSNLQQLMLQNVGVTTLPNQLLTSVGSTLRFLALRNLPQLSKIEANAFSALTELRLLTIVGNPKAGQELLSAGMLDNLTNLYYLELNNVVSANMSASIFTELSNLKSLKLVGSSITALPDSLFRLQELHSLDIFGTGINKKAQLCDIILKMPSLRSLRVSKASVDIITSKQDGCSTASRITCNNIGFVRGKYVCTITR